MDRLQRAPVTPEPETFEASALMPETWLLGLGGVVGICVLFLELFCAPSLARHGVQVMGAFFVTLFAFIYGFQRASTLILGVDGLLVRGTTRTRFVPYRGVTEVRERYGRISLWRGKRRVLSLEPHGLYGGSNVVALAMRLRRDILLAAERSGAEDLASAIGDSGPLASDLRPGDYRQAQLTTEQLWQLVEGAGTEARARIAAATALQMHLDGDGRARLATAARRCADPEARRLLLERASDTTATATATATR